MNSKKTGKGNTGVPGVVVQWNHRTVFFDNNPGPTWSCWLCGLIIDEQQRHDGEKNRCDVHHLDDDHDNDAPENLVAIGHGCHIVVTQTGLKRTKEQRRTLRNTHLGFSPIQETREKLSKALKGKPWSEARRQAQIDGTNAKRTRRMELDND